MGPAEACLMPWVHSEETSVIGTRGRKFTDDIRDSVGRLGSIGIIFLRAMRSHAGFGAAG